MMHIRSLTKSVQLLIPPVYLGAESLQFLPAKKHTGVGGRCDGSVLKCVVIGGQRSQILSVLFSVNTNHLCDWSPWVLKTVTTNAKSLEHLPHAMLSLVQLEDREASVRIQSKALKAVMSVIQKEKYDEWNQ